MLVFISSESKLADDISLQMIEGDIPERLLSSLNSAQSALWSKIGKNTDKIQYFRFKSLQTRALFRRAMHKSTTTTIYFSEPPLLPVLLVRVSSWSDQLVNLKLKLYISRIFFFLSAASVAQWLERSSSAASMVLILRLRVQIRVVTFIPRLRIRGSAVLLFSFFSAVHEMVRSTRFSHQQYYREWGFRKIYGYGSAHISVSSKQCPSLKAS